jgi:hypothetical protein
MSLSDVAVGTSMVLRGEVNGGIIELSMLKLEKKKCQESRMRKICQDSRKVARARGNV